MQDNFNDLLFLTITVDAKFDFINSLSFDERLLLKLFDKLETSPLEVHHFQREGCRKMAEKLFYYLCDKSFCSYTGICANPEKHWPGFCAPIGRIINEIEELTKVPNETHLDEMKSHHPAVEALYNHQRAIIERFNKNHKFRKNSK